VLNRAAQSAGSGPLDDESQASLEERFPEARCGSARRFAAALFALHLHFDHSFVDARVIRESSFVD
jgi:hypothetical protein